MAFGSSQGERYRGTRFDDNIDAGGGDDAIEGSPGEDTFDGGEGTDLVDYAAWTSLRTAVDPVDGIKFSDAVDVDLQRAVQHGGFAEGDVLISIEDVTGTGQNDVIRGNSLANLIMGNGGDDLLEGRGGDDTLFGEGLIAFSSGNQSGNDKLDGGSGNDQLFGELGNDTLIGGTGINKLDGGDGIDTASYAASASGMIISVAGAGNGIAFAVDNSVNDTLLNIENIIGSNLADQIGGSAAINVIDAGNGNDLIHGGGGADIMNGGGGVDTAAYGGSGAGVNVNLGVVIQVSAGSSVGLLQTVAGTGAGGDAQGDTLTGIENLIGSNFVDTLTGNLAANKLEGGAGDDVINGGSGNDLIVGGASVGPEVMSGGLGADTFVYLNRSDSLAVGSSPSDFVIDFEVAQDKLDFRALGLNAGQILIQSATVNGINGSIVTEDVNGNGQADNGEFAVDIIINGAGFVTLQDMLL
jgi:Ca2+-binding RTX toxin-like protein